MKQCVVSFCFVLYTELHQFNNHGWAKKKLRKVSTIMEPEKNEDSQRQSRVVHLFTSLGEEEYGIMDLEGYWLRNGVQGYMVFWCRCIVFVGYRCIDGSRFEHFLCSCKHLIKFLIYFLPFQKKGDEYVAVVRRLTLNK